MESTTIQFLKRSPNRKRKLLSQYFWSIISAPVNGNWGRWTEWNACDKPCGYGKRKRTRSCSDPAPKYGGKNCPGADTQYRMCNMMACPDSK